MDQPGITTITPRHGALSRLSGALLDIVFPQHCVRCGAMGVFICGACRAGMILAEGQRCRVCWIGGAAKRCTRCAYFRPSFSAARSVFIYDSEVLPVYEHDGAVRAAVHALKYRGISALAPVMAAPMADLLVAWSPEVEIMVPIPLFGMRQRIRGYNQSTLLAREIGRLTGIPVETGALERRRSTTPQVQQLGYDERIANTADAFAPGKRRLEGKRVLLVDDVMTTGATLDACARVLLDAGGGPVFALTFARED